MPQSAFRFSVAMCIAVVLLCVSSAPAQGPSSGWRGDGSGKYPDAGPPLQWGRTSRQMLALRSTVLAPAEGQADGTPLADGVIREWLVLGPVKVPQKDQELPGEAGLAPVASQKIGQLQWRKVAIDSAYLDFAKLIAKPEDDEAAAYAFARLYAPAAASFRLNLTALGNARVYVNGKPCQNMGTRLRLDLAAGWNRLLLRIPAGENDWYAVPVLHGWGKCEYQQTNIAWRTALPGVAPGFYGGGMGVGSPVIVGGKLYLPSEPHDLVCINKADGKVDWIRRSSYFECADDTDRKHADWPEAQQLAAKTDAINEAVVAGTATAAQLEEKAKLEKELQKTMKGIRGAKYNSGPIPDVGFSGFTPVTDGKSIYAWFGDGVSVCYAPDGARRWIRADVLPAVEHGFSSSPLLVDGMFIVFMRDLMAFDAATGRLVWQTQACSHEGFNPQGWFHASLVAARIGNQKVIALGNGMIVRAIDGKILSADKVAGYQAVASPVVEGRRLLLVSSNAGELITRMLPDEISDPLTLPTLKLKLDLSRFPKHYLPWHLSSPLVYEGLAYLVNNAGVLTVVDVEAGTIVYQKMLDLDPFQGHNEGASRGVGISPALAGRHIFVSGNNGSTLVFEPGRTWKQVAKNKIENVAAIGHWSERQERFVANPVFEGQRLYLRGEAGLYAIQAK